MKASRVIPTASFVVGAFSLFMLTRSQYFSFSDSFFPLNAVQMPLEDCLLQPSKMHSCFDLHSTLIPSGTIEKISSRSVESCDFPFALPLYNASILNGSRDAAEIGSCGDSTYCYHSYHSIVKNTFEPISFAWAGPGGSCPTLDKYFLHSGMLFSHSNLYFCDQHVATSFLSFYCERCIDIAVFCPCRLGIIMLNLA